MSTTRLLATALLTGCAAPLVPEAVTGFLPTDLLDQLSSEMDIFEGDSPPDLQLTRQEGYYFADDLVITRNDNGSTGDTYDLLFWFPEVTADGSATLTHYRGEDEPEDSYAAYISGSDGCFSVFYDTVGQRETCTYSRPIVYSACVTDTGDLSGFQYGAIMAGRWGESCESIVETGSMVLGELQDSDVTLTLFDNGGR